MVKTRKIVTIRDILGKEPSPSTVRKRMAEITKKTNSQAFEGTIQDVEETRLASREKLDCGKKKRHKKKG